MQVLVFDTDAITARVLTDPPRVEWCDGPRSGVERFDSIADAVRSVMADISERLALYGDQVFS